MFSNPKILQPFEGFDLAQWHLLFAENRLLEWIGPDQPFKKIDDFFQEKYFETQTKAFIWGLKTLPEKINFTWLHELHRKAVNGLKHESQSQDIPHYVRRTPIELIFHHLITF